MRVGVLGAGVLGTEVGRRLLRSGADAVVLYGEGSSPQRVADRLGNGALASSATVVDGSDPAVYVAERLDVVVLAGPDEVQADQARVALAAGCHVVSVADSGAAVDALLGFDEFAREVRRAVVVGAGVSPGWTTILAAHAASGLDEIDEVSLAVTGTAGPACLERRNAAVRTDAQEWRDGAWVECAARSGAELVWFPEPVGAVDCARGDMSDAVVLRRVLPDVGLISVKTERPEQRPLPRGVRRLTARWARPEAAVGGVRVAVSGRVDGQPVTVVEGMVAATDVAAAVLATEAVRRIVAGDRTGVVTPAELWRPGAALRLGVEAGLVPLVYEGID